jgi:hypothetical protein
VNFYGKNLHVIPKVLECCFVTKKFDFVDLGGRGGDKMAEDDFEEDVQKQDKIHSGN